MGCKFTNFFFEIFIYESYIYMIFTPHFPLPAPPARQYSINVMTSAALLVLHRNIHTYICMYK